MNLTLEPWIPALRADGRRELFSLHNLFAQSLDLRDLAVKPHERIALMRLLLCITQAALDGPADEDQWETSAPLIQPRVRDYLNKWKAAFELFGDGPRFLQARGLQAEKKSGEKTRATKLDLALATGNNATLFDNQAAEERPIEDARAALNLLAFQCFTPSEIVGSGVLNGTEIPKRTGRQAPCAASSMVHTLVLGGNLRETIWLNLLDRELAIDLYGSQGWGQPIWEVPISLSDSSSRDNATRTYLGRLVPVSRLIHLESDKQTILLVDGIAEYQLFDDPKKPQVIVFREPHSTILAGDEQIAVLRGDIAKSLWRQLGAVVAKRQGAGSVQEGPPALTRRTADRDLAIWIGCLVTTKDEGIVDSIESRYSLPKQMLDPSGFGRGAYEAGVEFAVRQSQRLAGLHGACSRYRFGLSHHVVAETDFDTKVDRLPRGEKQRLRDVLQIAETLFWTQVEQHLTALMELPRNTDLITDLPNCAWGKAVQAAARAAYEQSCPRQTPRQIQAYALGLRKLTFVPKPPKPTTASHE